MTKNKAIFEILLCAALWSVAGIFMKGIPWSGFAIAGVRSLLAGSVMLIFMRVKHIRFVVTRRSVMGAVALAATMTLFSVANKTTTAANAIVLQFTSPIWIMLFSAVIYRQRFRRAGGEIGQIADGCTHHIQHAFFQNIAFHFICLSVWIHSTRCIIFSRCASLAAKPNFS